MICSGDSVIQLQGRFPVDLQAEHQILDWLTDYAARYRVAPRFRSVARSDKSKLFERIASLDPGRVSRMHVKTIEREVGWSDGYISVEDGFDAVVDHVTKLMVECHPDRCRAFYSSDSFANLSIMRDRLRKIQRSRSTRMRFRW